MNVIIPAAIQIIMRSSGESSCCAIVAGLRKIPEPIIEPATIIIVAVNVNPRTNSVFLILLPIFPFSKSPRKIINSREISKKIYLLPRIIRGLPRGILAKNKKVEAALCFYDFVRYNFVLPKETTSTKLLFTFNDYK